MPGHAIGGGFFRRGLPLLALASVPLNDGAFCAQMRADSFVFCK